MIGDRPGRPLIVLRSKVTLLREGYDRIARHTTSTKLHIGYFLLACTTLSACSSNRGRIAPDEIGPESRFGSAVAVSEDYRFVGAPGHGGPGTVFVFASDGDSDPLTSFVPFQGSTGDEFGRALDADGDAILVGAPVSEIDGILGGRAFVWYSPDQNLWIQEDDLQALAPSDLDYFGSSVALYADLAVVGSPGDDEEGSNAGAAFVFRRDASGWSFVAKLLASDVAAGDRFGESVATNGHQIIVGSPFAFGASTRTGAAYVFRPAGSSFELEQRLLPDRSNREQTFGASVTLEDGFAFIGAPGPGNPDAPGGTVSIFSLVDDVSTLAEILTSGPSVSEAGFGASLDSFSGFLMVGSQRFVGDHPGPGSAWIYSGSGSSWTLLSPLTGSDVNRADGFGKSVSISSGLASVGAAGDATSGPNAGAAYFYSGDSDNWR